MPRCRIIVKGRVQGVGFRFFVSRTANGMGLKGFVRNLPNGCVEAIAEGSKELLERFVKLLADGPITSSVEDLEIKWEEEKGEFQGFGINY